MRTHSDKGTTHKYLQPVSTYKSYELIIIKAIHMNTFETLHFCPKRNQDK